jgi:hypothetical protein
VGERNQASCSRAHHTERRDFVSGDAAHAGGVRRKNRERGMRGRDGRAERGGRAARERAATAVYLEVGSRDPHDLITCSDVDMMSSNADGRFVHKDGTPYPAS